jgi:hypothetical protein
VGLALCRAVAGAHGGSIRAETTPGGGATLVVRLPLADGAGRSDAAEAVRQQRARRAETRRAAGASQRPAAAGPAAIQRRGP